MDFDLNDEQRLLKESIDRLMADRYGFEERQGYIRAEGGYDRALWQEYADLGLLALPFREEDGGIGGGPEEVMLVMEAFGRALAVEPYLTGVVMASSLVNALADEAQRAALVPGIVSGETRLAIAHAEMGAGNRLSHVATTARAGGEGLALDGAKTLVLHGGTADAFLLTARLSGETGDESGLGVFLVPADAPGLTRRDYPTQDGMRAAELTLENVRLEGTALLGNNRDAFPALARMQDEAIAALCAEAVGAMEKALELTVDYLKVRKQFGRPIGEFQVLQHRAAEMLIELEQSRSMAIYATMMAREENAAVRSRAISAAKVQIGKAARFIGQQAVQLHGGIGVTMEAAIGHYFKRLTMIEKAFGDTDHHMERLAEAGGLAA